jgi:hypothetical protein
MKVIFVRLLTTDEIESCQCEIKCDCGQCECKPLQRWIDAKGHRYCWRCIATIPHAWKEVDRFILSLENQQKFQEHLNGIWWE